MPNAKLKNQLHLHFIVFIWGFTAILAALISIEAMPLVWYRVLIAATTLFLFLKIKKTRFDEKFNDLIKFSIGGVIIALHWVTFFYAIKISTVSTTLITLSSSAFFVVILKLLFVKNKFIFYELLLALIAVFGFVIIFRSEKLYVNGMIIALLSAFLIALFSLYNSKLIKSYKADKIAFFELLFAFLFISIVLIFKGAFSFDFFELSNFDWMYIVILAIICTAYPFVIATSLLKKMSPFTIILTNNLEPVYGIILALMIFGEKERMSWQFYLGAVIIFCSILLNALIKNRIVRFRYKSK